MCGYCTKDMGKPHHRKVTHNVTDGQINAGSSSLVSPTSHMYDYISNEAFLFSCAVCCRQASVGSLPPLV